MTEKSAIDKLYNKKSTKIGKNNQPVVIKEGQKNVNKNEDNDQPFITNN